MFCLSNSARELSRRESKGDVLGVLPLVAGWLASRWRWSRDNGQLQCSYPIGPAHIKLYKHVRLLSLQPTPFLAYLIILAKTQISSELVLRTSKSGIFSKFPYGKLRNSLYTSKGCKGPVRQEWMCLRLFNDKRRQKLH